jgi:hypothetical protein
MFKSLKRFSARGGSSFGGKSLRKFKSNQKPRGSGVFGFSQFRLSESDIQKIRMLGLTTFKKSLSQN